MARADVLVKYSHPPRVASGAALPYDPHTAGCSSQGSGLTEIEDSGGGRSMKLPDKKHGQNQYRGRVKLCGNLEDLLRTAAFVRATGISI
nr:hypothetical protein BaRGS_000703 [Batillaria attramentaria]